MFRDLRDLMMDRAIGGMRRPLPADLDFSKIVKTGQAFDGTRNARTRDLFAGSIGQGALDIEANHFIRQENAAILLREFMRRSTPGCRSGDTRSIRR